MCTCVQKLDKSTTFHTQLFHDIEDRYLFHLVTHAINAQKTQF